MDATDPSIAAMSSDYKTNVSRTLHKGLTAIKYINELRNLGVNGLSSAHGQLKHWL
jgi:hypothetical protein